MLNSKMFNSLMIAVLLACGSVAHAEVYNFGSLTSWTTPGYTPPGTVQFAQLEATDNGGGIWDFSLTVDSNFTSHFGDNSFVKLMNFNYTIDPTSLPVSTMTGSNVGGVTSVTSKTMTAPNFATVFGSPGYRLSENDWVTWTVSGLDPNSQLETDKIYLVVGGIDGGYSAHYTPIASAVPEPGTYAMMLAGLGLIGFSARRRA